MILKSLSILNFKNIREANLDFADKINCFVGLNGQGKTNLLDAIYYLSFTKSYFNVIDSQNITHDADFALIKGEYEDETISCGLKRGQKKQFRRGKKDYQRLIDHIGLIPLVMVSPQDSELITDGSDERRRFIDSVISQLDRPYLEHLTKYNALLKQRNALLKQSADSEKLIDSSLFEVLELQMAGHADYIFRQRTAFVERFVPIFQELYAEIAGTDEHVTLSYQSQLQDRGLVDAFRRTRSRDIILGWTSQGIHKDDLPMQLGDYPLRQVASQGQQKTFLLALKLAQALYLSEQPAGHLLTSLNSPQGASAQPAGRLLTARRASLNSPQGTSRPILLLDDIFDKLDATRVERIIRLIQSDRFGQIFITDTDRQHLTEILQDSSTPDEIVNSNSSNCPHEVIVRRKESSRVFLVHNGIIEST